MCDHVLNSHDHFVLKSSDITRRNLTLITLIGLKGLKAICDLSPPQRFNEALLDYPIANIEI